MVLAGMLTFLSQVTQGSGKISVYSRLLGAYGPSFQACIERLKVTNKPYSVYTGHAQIRRAKTRVSQVAVKMTHPLNDFACCSRERSLALPLYD
jgi:hypothetical protein